MIASRFELFNCASFPSGDACNDFVPTRQHTKSGRCLLNTPSDAGDPGRERGRITKYIWRTNVRTKPLGLVNSYYDKELFVQPSGSCAKP